jgi:para-nitrobenzyl esterase
MADGSILDCLRRVCGAAVAIAALTCSAPAQAAIPEPVKVKSGLITGTPGRDASVTIYKGIPYAAPPIGALRWRTPQPAAPWQGVRKADTFGNPCPQARGKTIVGAEDCLFLNVWTGAASSTERRPVLVWSYMDGFLGNDSANPLWEGEGLARKGVIVVTVNYRPGVMGFLATPELSKESGHNASGAYGILDQIAALQWVHDNIAAFGGDPDKVTIAGQSAGGLSTLLLMSSPLAKGLYRGAILESRARGLTPTLAEGEAQGMKYMEAHGARSIAELRALPLEKLKEGDTFSRPTIEGWAIPANFYQLFVNGLQHNVPVMIGGTKDESGSTTHPNVTVDAFQKLVQQRYGERSGEFLTLYPATTDEAAGQAKNAAARDDARTTDFLLATQGPNGGKNKSFTYFWTHAPPGPDSDRQGAFHGSELNYVFNNLYATDRPWTDEDRKIADMMSSYWANFIKTGDPNGDGLPAWKPLDVNAPAFMELGDRFGPAPLPEKVKMDFIKRQYLSNGATPGWR